VAGSRTGINAGYDGSLHASLCAAAGLPRVKTRRTAQNFAPGTPETDIFRDSDGMRRRRRSLCKMAGRSAVCANQAGRVVVCPFALSVEKSVKRS